MKNSTKLPVSKKFYADIRQRLAVSLSICNSPMDTLTNEAVKVIDSYLSDGIEPDRNTDISIRLAFSLLRPEIDKAIERSRRARQCKKQTKHTNMKCVNKDILSNSLACTSSNAGTSVSCDTGNDEKPAAKCSNDENMPESYPLNRRMRRLIEQERKRHERRKIKPLQKQPQVLRV